MINLLGSLSVGIISWNGKHEAAALIASHAVSIASDVVVIHSEEQGVKRHGDGRWINVSDEMFFGRKFEVLLSEIPAGNALLLIQADASCSDWEAVVRRCHQVLANTPSIGLWSPGFDNSAFPNAIVATGKHVDGLIPVMQTDAIVLGINAAVLERLGLLEYSKNNLGWGIDWAAVAFCYVNGLGVVRDAYFKIEHPRSRGYSGTSAEEEMRNFLRLLSAQEFSTVERLKMRIEGRAKAVSMANHTNNNIPENQDKSDMAILSSPEGVAEGLSFVYLQNGKVVLGAASSGTNVSVRSQNMQIDAVVRDGNYPLPMLLDFSSDQRQGVSKSFVTGTEWSCPGQATQKFVISPLTSPIRIPLIAPIEIPVQMGDLHLRIGVATHRLAADILIEWFDDADRDLHKEVWTKLSREFTGNARAGDYQKIDVRIPDTGGSRNLQVTLCIWNKDVESKEPGVVLCTRPYLIASTESDLSVQPKVLSVDEARQETVMEISFPPTHDSLTLLCGDREYPLLTRTENLPCLQLDGEKLTASCDVYECFSLYINGRGTRLIWLGPDSTELSISPDVLGAPGTRIELRDTTGSIVCASFETKVPDVNDRNEASSVPRHPDVWAIETMFDRGFYLSGFNETDRPSDPETHYLEQGWLQGRDPAPWFSTWHYLSTHKDVVEAGVNPFLHYCVAGHAEARALVSLGHQPRANGGNATLFDQQFSVAIGARSPEFAPLTTRHAPVSADLPKTIAFYLPQFHAFAENDAWWGKGFTEWTNVSKAVPQFSGHNQPRLPGEMGFYDLKIADVFVRQIELARQFGIHGFCFHYYWFGGHRLLEKPIELFLARKDKAFDMPFCLCWANENWTRRWDGAEDDVLMKQTHNAEDHLAVFDDLLRYMKDPRYIKVGNRPVLVVYRPTIIDDLSQMVEIWRRRAVDEGFDGLFLVATNSFGFSEYQEIGFDALCEFPPHNVAAGEISGSVSMHNSGFAGKVYSYTDARDFSLRRLSEQRAKPDSAAYFPTVMMSWDNEARKPGRGHVFHGASPVTFYPWMKGAMDYSMAAHEPDARMVFVNAWNEWGEGTYLEPDRWFGYGYLNAVAAAYDSLAEQPTFLAKMPRRIFSSPRKRGVVFLHAFYFDLVEEFAERLNAPWFRDDFDIVLTVPQHWTEHQRASADKLLKPTEMLVTPNVGRDIYPFLEALHAIGTDGYDLALKIHTKKSPHLPEGARWRKAILDSLMREGGVKQALKAFASNPRLGMLAPKSTLMPYHDAASLRDNQATIDWVQERYGLKVPDSARVVAGSMFWFRPAAFEPLLTVPMTAEDFGPELGAIDGTAAHAMERLMPSIVTSAGFVLESTDDRGGYNPYK